MALVAHVSILKLILWTSVVELLSRRRGRQPYLCAAALGFFFFFFFSTAAISLFTDAAVSTNMESNLICGYDYNDGSMDIKATIRSSLGIPLW